MAHFLPYSDFGPDTHLSRFGRVYATVGRVAQPGLCLSKQPPPAATKNSLEGSADIPKAEGGLHYQRECQQILVTRKIIS